MNIKVEIMMMKIVLVAQQFRRAKNAFERFWDVFVKRDEFVQTRHLITSTMHRHRHNETAKAILSERFASAADKLDNIGSKLVSFISEIASLER